MVAHTDLGSPLFLLNLKAYPTSIGDAALALGRLLAEKGSRRGVRVAVAPTPTSVALLARDLRIPVLSQHADAMELGARTGHIPPATIRAAGGRGSLVNHSEHRLSSDAVKATVEMLLSEGLTAVVCAGDVKESAALAGLCHPPYLAVEPPELIGGTVSVSSARPEVIRETVAAVRAVSPGTRVLCGAGIKDGTDVRRALELGAHGVLVASAVASSKEPANALDLLLGGFPAGAPSPSSEGPRR